MIYIVMYSTLYKEYSLLYMAWEKGMKLANNLRRCRFDRDEMSQDFLAKSVGVTRQTIISIEKGRFIPSTLLALKLARFFGLSVEQIFFINEDGEA